MSGKYYTPKEIVDPASGSGAFLKDAADYLLSNPPYAAEQKMHLTAAGVFLIGFILGLVIAAAFALVLFGGR